MSAGSRGRSRRWSCPGLTRPRSCFGHGRRPPRGACSRSRRKGRWSGWVGGGALGQVRMKGACEWITPRLLPTSIRYNHRTLDVPRALGRRMSTEAEKVLIKQIRRGDQTAWERLINLYEGRLMAFAVRRVRDRAAAEDIVQETFIGFLNSLPN